MINNIEVFTQNSIRIKAEGKTIYADPYQMKDAPHDADYIFITHDHYDHYSPENIEKVRNSGTVLVVPEKMSDKIADKAAFKSVITVKQTDSTTVDDIAFETIPAYNILKPFHPKGAGYVGYILTLGGKRIYIAGDTDATPEAKAVKCDIALVPIGDTYTMNPKAAAELINTIRPEYAIPTHYGNVVGKPADGDVFEKNVKAPVKTVIKIRF